MIRTITPIFSILLAIIVFVTFTQPMFGKIKETNSLAQSYDEAAKNAKTLNDNLSSKLNKIASFSPQDLEKLDALAAPDINEVRALADLSAIARTHNMLFGNVSIRKKDQQGPLVVYQDGEAVDLHYSDLDAKNISFSLIGTYEQFKQYLADLERSLVIYEVTDIGISAGDGQLQQFSISLRIFGLPHEGAKKGGTK